MKALALFSGGLDSMLAIKLVREQGIEVIALNFNLPILSEKRAYADQIAEQLSIPLLKIEAGEDYLELIRNPKHGYGKNMNPCIDCRIYMLKEAKRQAQKLGASFIITGEVLGQRPMSQYEQALKREEKEARVEGLVLRPLSTKLLPETVPEREGWVDRDRLLSIRGKSRKPQLALAQEYGIEGYHTPAGGCLLTDKQFSLRLKDLFNRQKRITKRDIQLLKLGRHFYLPSARIIVGRNESENKALLELKSPADYIFKVPDLGSPITILEGCKDKEAIEFAAKLTAQYSDAETSPVLVEYGRNKEESIVVESRNFLPMSR